MIPRNLTPKKIYAMTGVLAVYAAVMAFVGRDILLVQHDYLRYFGSLGAEILVICLLYFMLHRLMRKQQQRAREWEDDRD